MNADLTFLLELQEADLARDALLKERNAVPASVRAIEEGIAKKRVFLEQRRAHLDRIKKSRGQREKDLDCAVAKLEERRGTLKSFKSNEVFQAAQRELEQARKANTVIEEEVLNLMEEVESVSKEISSIEEAIRARQDELAAERVRNEAAMRDLDVRVAEMEDRVRSIAERIDPGLLADYRRARSKRGGIGLARTSGGRCLACHMEIPPQMYNELIKGTSHHDCPSCQRILYYRDEPDAQAAALGAQPGPEA